MNEKLIILSLSICILILILNEIIFLKEIKRKLKDNEYNLENGLSIIESDEK